MKGLIIVGSLKDGGAQKIMYDYVSRIHKDIKFEFACYDSEPGIFGEKLNHLGIPYHVITPFSKSFGKHKKELIGLLKNGQFDFVHDNGGYRSYFNLKYAKKCGVKTRIAHAHLCNIPENPNQLLLRNLFTFLTKKVATDLYACSNETGRWTWGEKDFQKGKVHVQNNAIQINRYLFNQEKRTEIRKQLEIENKFVIGHIGRFTSQKNHAFLIKAFDTYHKLNHKAVLMLIGTGELEIETKHLVCNLGLQDSVMFLGMRKDVNELLNAMDLFVLPSRYEGFAVALLEAATNGLPCITNTGIGVASCFSTINIVKRDDFEGWQKALIDHGERIEKVDLNRIREDGLDIDTNAERQRDLYIETVKRNTINE